MGALNFIQVRTLALSIPPFSTQERGGRACLAAFPGEQGESGHFLLSQVRGKSSALTAGPSTVLSDHRPWLC